MIEHDRRLYQKHRNLNNNKTEWRCKYRRDKGIDCKASIKTTQIEHDENGKELEPQLLQLKSRF
jgi:hypothetical protein